MAETRDERWTKPSTILVASDLSDADRLMPFALEQARETGARLILLHVLGASESIAVDAVGLPYYDPATALEYATKTLQHWCAEAVALGIGCEAHVCEGAPAQQILTAVRQHHVDRILLGTRSRSKLSKLFLGSVAEQVLRSVNIPVMTVGPEAHLPVSGKDGDAVVLHATTLHEASRPSAVLACRIARNRGARLVLLHVQPPEEIAQRKHTELPNETSVCGELKQIAADAMADDACGCSSIEPMVVHGNPAIEILATAANLHADLIVLGGTNRSALENLARDRTIYRVLAHARCPVLTLREPASVHTHEAAEKLALHL